MINKFVWFNPYLPQTLLVVVAISYFRAIFDILFSLGNLSLIGWAITLLTVAGAFGIANLRLWGYILAIIIAILPFALPIGGSFVFDYTLMEYFRAIVSGPNLIGTIFQIAIIALLLHPMSRNFVKERFEKTIP